MTATTKKAGGGAARVIGIAVTAVVMTWMTAGGGMHQAWAQSVVTSQTPSAAAVGRYTRFELTFTLSRTYTNPFDADEADIRVRFTQPDSSEITVPAFFTKDFDVLAGAPEQYINGRNPSWKARFAPNQFGEHAYEIIVTDALGTETVPGAATFTCMSSAQKGFIERDPQDPYLLRHETGEPYFPIGHNTGWAPNTTGLAWWTQHFDSAADVGINWARIWMTHFNGGHILEWSTEGGPYYQGVGKMSLEMAWKLDKIVEAAEQRGIAVQLALQHHGQFSTVVNANWNDNPYNVTNAAADGGWLTSPAEFFTDAEARRLTRNKYRYIIARWGYSTAIHSWEFFNEVQFTNGWNLAQQTVIDWHEEMAQYVRSIDPFDHLVTTSSDQSGFDAIWAMPEIDLVQVHSYTQTVLPAMQAAVARLRSFGKPVLIAEYGLVAVGSIPEVDPASLPQPQQAQVLEGLHLHNGMWAAFHMKSGGHLWWWDNYIEARNLFNVYRPLSRYAAGEDIGAKQMGSANVILSTETQTSDVIFQPNAPGITEFFGIPLQTSFTADASGVITEFWKHTLYLHGSSKEAYRSDPTITTNFGSDVALRLMIDEVSGWGENSLRIRVDGVEAATVSPPNGAADLQIETTIPAGQHTVTIENTGQDWFRISNYAFGAPGSNILRAFGLAGNNAAYLWIYDIGSQYGSSDHGSIFGAQFYLTGMAAGVYTLEYHATRGAGGLIQTQEAEAVDGVLSGTLPPFSRDIAVKVKGGSTEPHVPAANRFGKGVLLGGILVGALCIFQFNTHDCNL